MLQLVHTAPVCFIQFRIHTDISYMTLINKMEMKCIFCKIGITLHYIIYMNFKLRGLNMKHQNS